MVQQYYEGLSENEICRNIEQQHGYKPANSTIYRWLEEFTKRAIRDTKEIHPEVGDTWIADETVIKVGGKNYWFWDCIDADTRFLLASRMVTTRGKADARALMEQTEQRAGKTPKVVVTDHLNSYLDGIELAFGADTEHRQGSPFNLENNTNLIERFQGSLKDRAKILRGLKTPQTARRFLEGWLIHYNYFKPHLGIDGKTPAEAAKVKFEHKNWLDLVRDPKDTARIEVHVEPRPILRLHHPTLPQRIRLRTSKPRTHTPRRKASPPGIYRRGLLIANHPFRGAKLVYRRRRGGKK